MSEQDRLAMDRVFYLAEAYIGEIPYREAEPSERELAAGREAWLRIQQACPVPVQCTNTLKWGTGPGGF